MLTSVNFGLSVDYEGVNRGLILNMNVPITVMTIMAHKDTRSILVNGHSLSVSLPHTWLKYYGIKAGDKVEVITEGRVAHIILPDNGGESGKKEDGEREHGNSYTS